MSNPSSVGEARQEAARAAQMPWICVGKARSYTARSTTIRVAGRIVALLRAENKWHCIDAVCYHAGGPLTDGALTRIESRLCVRCPWHSYLVDIEDGHALYMDLSRKYVSKGVRQRTHDVQLRGGVLWVRLREDGSVASDTYAKAQGEAFERRVQRTFEAPVQQ